MAKLSIGNGVTVCSDFSCSFHNLLGRRVRQYKVRPNMGVVRSSVVKQVASIHIQCKSIPERS